MSPNHAIKTARRIIGVLEYAKVLAPMDAEKKEEMVRACAGLVDRYRRRQIHRVLTRLQDENQFNMTLLIGAYDTETEPPNAP